MTVVNVPRLRRIRKGRKEILWVTKIAHSESAEVKLPMRNRIGGDGRNCRYTLAVEAVHSFPKKKMCRTASRPCSPVEVAAWLGHRHCAPVKVSRDGCFCQFGRASPHMTSGHLPRRSIERDAWGA
jgi:hypothetical protein